MKSKKFKVGIFLIGGAILFAVGLFLIGNHNQVFAHHFDVYTEFPGVDTIQTGAMVRVSGMDAGEVSEIDIPHQPSSNFRVKLHVDKKFESIIRKDSLTTIETEGMVGNKYVNIEKGSNGSPECSGCTLPSKPPVELAQLMSQAQGIMQTTQGAIGDIQHHAVGAIDNFSNVGRHADQMVVSMRGNVDKITSNGAAITEGVNGIVSNIRGGRGAAGKLLSDPKVAQNVQAVVEHAKNTTQNLEQASTRADTLIADFQKKNIPEDVHQTLANTRDITKDIKGAVGNFTAGPSGQNTATEVQQTLAEAHRASENLASDTEAIKHNFFLRGFFKRRGFYDLNRMNPSEYAASEFVKHPAKRVWLPADGLFTTASNGTEQLSKEGEAALSRAVSQIAADLPNNPLVVEGYAEESSAAKSFLAARQRADAVRNYLDSHFHLNADLIGTIPLGDKPPRGTGKESWNGVCLALVVSKK